jgi:hypothetical protein
MCVKPTVLIIDETGCLKLDPNRAHYLFQVIARRYEHAPIILTSKQKLWGMGRSHGGFGIGDRDVQSITASFRIFNLKGESHRLREKGSNRKNRRIHEVLPGNFKPAILGKKSSALTIGKDSNFICRISAAVQ